MKDKFIGRTRKVRTVSIDTDVVNDLIAEGLGYSSIITKSSNEIFTVLSAKNIKITFVGCPVVRKELQAIKLERFYDVIFDKEVSLSKEVRNLANEYVKQLNIKGSDALIAASASVAGVDIVLTRDKQHMLKYSILDKLREINRKKNVAVPVFISPAELHERIFIADRSICVSHEIIPLQFRLQISYPK